MYYGKALAMCGASLIAAVAVAGTPRNPIVIAQPQNLVERRISYADLNLADATGVRVFSEYAEFGACQRAFLRLL